MQAERLYDAAHSGDVSAVEQLLLSHVNVDCILPHVYMTHTLLSAMYIVKNDFADWLDSTYESII